MGQGTEQSLRLRRPGATGVTEPHEPRQEVPQCHSTSLGWGASVRGCDPILGARLLPPQLQLASGRPGCPPPLAQPRIPPCSGPCGALLAAALAPLCGFRLAANMRLKAWGCPWASSTALWPPASQSLGARTWLGLGAQTFRPHLPGLARATSLLGLSLGPPHSALWNTPLLGCRGPVHPSPSV